MGGAVLVGTAVAVVGAWVVAGTIVVVTASVAVVSVLLLHAETTSSAATTTSYFFTIPVCHRSPEGRGETSGALGVDTQGYPPPFDFWETETVMGLTGRFAALAVLVVISLSTAIGCSGNRDYDEEVRNAFLTNCEYAGSSPSVCSGALECIEERLTQSDFEYEENKLLLTGELSERMVEISARCLNR